MESHDGADNDDHIRNDHIVGSSDKATVISENWVKAT